MVHLFKLAESSKQDPSILPEAQRVQGIVARADFTIAKTSLAGIKYLLQRLYGYGGLTRKPLPEIGPDAAQALWNHPHTSDIVKLETELTDKKAA
jgi:4-hydroxy-2-oxoglutarate aldolase